jgi:hypothetical protein
MKLFLIAALTATLALAQPGGGKGKGKGGPGGPPPAPVPSIPCDRACLLEIADQYFAALVAHDPSKVSFATNAKFVENSAKLKPGEGLWTTASAAPSAFKILVPDPVSGQVGFIVVLKEKPAPGTVPAAPPAGAAKGKGPAAPALDANGNRDVLLGGRLKIVNKQITEAEHLRVVANNPNLVTPRPKLLAEVPAAQRNDRETLLAAGRAYYDALDNSMGSLAPFADDCERHENGMNTTANAKCGPQLNTHTFDYIDTINNRRVEIADPVTGLVIGFSHFRHPMDRKTFRVYDTDGKPRNNPDGTPMMRDMTTTNPFDLPAAHIYKVTGGQIHEIEAVGFSLPLNSKTGWE